MFIWDNKLLASNRCISRRVYDIIIASAQSIIVVKHFLCVISLELKLFARRKKHLSYFSAMYPHLIVQKYDEFLAIFEFLMNTKTDFRISLRQKRLVQYILLLETRLHVPCETSYLISSVSGQISANYKELQDAVIFGLKRLSFFLFCILLYLLYTKR